MLNSNRKESLTSFKALMFDKIRNIATDLEFDTTISDLRWVAFNLANAGCDATSTDDKDCYLGQLKTVSQVMAILSIINEAANDASILEADIKGGGDEQ